MHIYIYRRASIQKVSGTSPGMLSPEHTKRLPNQGRDQGPVSIGQHIATVCLISNGARRVHLIITMMNRIRTSRLCLLHFFRARTGVAH